MAPIGAAVVRENTGKVFSESDGAIVFKAANKSTVWYNVKAFTDAGVTPPKTWEEFLANAKTIGASGTPAYSIAGADGWTLTDLFENIYLRQAGGDKYDQLTDHEIPWTDESVKTALKSMATIMYMAPSGWIGRNPLTADSCSKLNCAWLLSVPISSSE